MYTAFINCLMGAKYLPVLQRIATVSFLLFLPAFTGNRDIENFAGSRFRQRYTTIDLRWKCLESGHLEHPIEGDFRFIHRISKMIFEVLSVNRKLWESDWGHKKHFHILKIDTSLRGRSIFQNINSVLPASCVPFPFQFLSWKICMFSFAVQTDTKTKNYSFVVSCLMGLKFAPFTQLITKAIFSFPTMIFEQNKIWNVLYLTPCMTKLFNCSSRSLYHSRYSTQS